VTPTVTSFSTYAGAPVSLLRPAVIRIGAPFPGRLRAPVTTPRLESITPGDPTPTPVSSRVSTPASAQASAMVAASASTMSSGPPLRGVGWRAWATTERLPSSTTAWILVPPRSRPPTSRRREGLMPAI
jgi:hypothetical protein